MNNLQSKIKDKIFLVTSELNPPKGTDLSTLFNKVELTYDKFVKGRLLYKNSNVKVFDEEKVIKVVIEAVKLLMN